VVDEDILLAEHARVLGSAGRALAELGEGEPMLASDLGLEVASLEARLILGTGTLSRVSRLGGKAGHGDLGRMERLETLVRMADARVAERLAMIDGQEGSKTWQSIAGAVSLAGGIVSIAKQVF